MRLRVSVAVFRAELASVLRDRRTMMTSLLIPVLLYPLGGLGLTTMASHSLSVMRAEVATVCVRAASSADADAIGIALPPEKLGRVPCATDAAPGEAADAIIDVPAGAAAAIAAGSGVDLSVSYDSSGYRGPRANDRIDDALADYGKTLVTKRITDARLPARFASPIHVKAKDVAPPTREELFAWAPALVVFLVFFSVFGVFLPSIDVTAGDRERMTLETLLTSPASTTELIVGKFGVVFAIGMFTTLLNIGSLYSTLSVVSSTAKELHIGAVITAGNAVVLLLCSIPSVAMAASVTMALGCLARSFRDAQNFLTPVYLALLAPAYYAAAPNAKLTGFSAAVPMLNLSLTMREVIAGTLDLRLLAIGTVVNLVFGAVALYAAGRLYGHEGLAFADAEPIDLLRRPAVGTPRFSGAEGLALFGIALALVFYAGIPLQTRSATAGLAATELALVLAPPALWAWWRRVDAREAFALRLPGWRGAIAAVLFGAGCWVPIMLFSRFVQEPVFPMPPGAEKAIRDAIGVGTLPLPLLLAAGALLPALCEETLFRGAILQSLKPNLGRWAVVLTALLFAVLHLDPWRFVSTFALGIVAGMLVASTGSIASGMLFHFTNNAVAVLITRGSPSADDAAPLASAVMIAGAACLPLATWILFGPRRTGITGAINAGGRGSRLGNVAKPLLAFADGSTLLARTSAILRTRCDDVILVANDPAPFASANLEIVADRIPDRGAPGGLHAALSAIDTPWLLLVAGDMPGIDGRVLDALIRRRTPECQAVVAIVDGRPEPLHALWSKDVLPLLDEMLRAGEPSFKDVLARIPRVEVSIEELEREIPGARRSFANVNTPDDLAPFALHPPA